MRKEKAVKFTSVFRAHKSQYAGEYIYQLEMLVNGDRKVAFYTARTAAEAKKLYRAHLALLKKIKSNIV